MRLSDPTIRYVPLDACEALVGLESVGAQTFATVTLIDGQNSATTVERVEFEHGVGRRTCLNTNNPFYFPAPSTGNVFAYVEAGQLSVTGRDPVTVPIARWGTAACVATPDGERVFINTQEQLLRVEVSTGQIEEVAAAHDQWFGLCMSPDGRAVAAATNSVGCEVSIFDTSTLERVQQFALDAFVYQPAFSPDGAHIVVGDSEGVLLLDRGRGEFRRIRQTGFEVLSCVFDPSGRYVASAERDLVVVDRQTDQPVLSWSLDALRQQADLTPAQHEHARTLIADPEFVVTDDTEAGSGVSAVRWAAGGLVVVTFGGRVWQFSVEPSK